MEQQVMTTMTTAELSDQIQSAVAAGMTAPHQKSGPTVPEWVQGVVVTTLHDEIDECRLTNGKRRKMIEGKHWKKVGGTIMFHYKKTLEFFKVA